MRKPKHVTIDLTYGSRSHYTHRQAQKRKQAEIQEWKNNLYFVALLAVIIITWCFIASQRTQ